MNGSVEPAREGDRERVQCGLPAHHPACPSTAGGVKGAGDHIQTLQRRRLVREMAPGPHGATVAGVDRLNGVCRANDPSHLHVIEPVAECVSVRGLGLAAWDDSLMAKGFRPVLRDQAFLLPPDMREWLPDDHLVWFVLDTIDALDVSEF